MSCLSTPFLWCLPKETVSSRQRKAPFLPWRLHHSRERYRSVVYTFLARLGAGAGAVFWRIARMKVSSTFSKVAGCRGGAFARAPQSAELSFCSHKRRRGSKGEPSPGVPPFLYASTCAPIRWEGVVGLHCLSTPFLLSCQKKRCRAAKEKRLFLPRWLHHSRERYQSVDGTFLARLGAGLVLVGGMCVCAVFLGGGFWPLLPVPPHFFALAQRNGVEPQRNALLGAATAAVRSHPPLPRTRSPNITADCVKLT